MVEQRSLYRSRGDRMIAGVCGGIADYFGVDPTLVRLIAVLLLVVGNGVTFFVYIIMAIVVPEEPLDVMGAPPVPGSSRPSAPPIPSAAPLVPEPGAAPMAAPEGASVAAPYAETARASEPTPQPPVTPSTPWVPPVPEVKRGRRGGIGVGFFLIVLGVAFLAAQFIPGIAWWNLWPLVIVVAGIVQCFTPGAEGWNVYRFFDGLGTIAVGVVLLGNMTGYIAWNFWWILLTLWPVLLIAAGFGILGKGTHQEWLRVIGSIAVLLAFAYAGVVSYTGASGMLPRPAWVVGTGGTPYSFTEPGGNVAEAKLDLKGGAGDIVIAEGTQLAEVSGQSPFSAPEVSVVRSGNTADVTVSLGDTQQPVIVAPGISGARMDVKLSDVSLWDIALQTGASSVNADLSRVRVKDLQLKTGVSSAVVKLGDVPDGVQAASVTVKAGVSSVRILLPDGAEARVETNNGLSSVRVGGRFEKSGNQWETPGYSSASKVYDISIKSGIGSVSVDTY